MSAVETETEQQQPALKVQDALGYLDQVKSKFNDQPYVYNQFLDIMKEFKSQSLDTPGVIAKVSTLFRGHTDLIVGFNTFLPPGYRIEQMPHNNEIRITTLQGIQGTPATFTLAQHQQQHQQQIQQAQQIQQPQQIQQTQPQIQQQQQQIQAPQLQTQQIQPQQLPPQPIQSQQIQPQQITTQPIVVNQNDSSKQHVQQQQPPPPPPPSAIQPGSEFGFNHALNYVNKIKHRFSANPEVYQQFLEILHTYQRDQHATKVPRSKMLLESEVYNQVARLFQNQRDLLEEFSQFLPDANGTGSASSNINSLARVHHQLTPGSNINSSNASSLGLRHDGSLAMSEDMAPVKRQNSRGSNQNKISIKRQNNSVGNLTYNSSKVGLIKIFHIISKT